MWRYVLWPKIWFILVTGSSKFEKNVYSPVWHELFYECQKDQTDSSDWYIAICILTLALLLYLPVTSRKALKSDYNSSFYLFLLSVQFLPHVFEAKLWSAGRHVYIEDCFVFLKNWFFLFLCNASLVIFLVLSLTLFETKTVTTDFFWLLLASYNNITFFISLMFLTERSFSVFHQWLYHYQKALHVN